MIESSVELCFYNNDNRICNVPWQRQTVAKEARMVFFGGHPVK